MSYNESNGVLTVNYAIDYYSHLQHLMDKPHAVPYEIIINKLELLVIPTDFMQTLQIVSLGLFGAYFIRNASIQVGIFVICPFSKGHGRVAQLLNIFTTLLSSFLLLLQIWLIVVGLFNTIQREID